MSAAAPRELMILVERIVRPLPLPFIRQKRLRADYLEHLQEMYAHELAAGSKSDGAGPAEALERVRQRFGDPAQITAELRQAIPWWQRWQTRNQNVISPRPDESLSGFVARSTGQFFLATLVLMALITADHHFFGVEPISVFKIRAVLAVVLFSSSWVGCFLLFGLHTGAAWERRPRPWPRIIALSLAHFATWPLSLVSLMFLAGGSWSDYSMPLVGTFLGGLFSVICGIFMGVMHSRDAAYRREWSELDLDAA